MRTIDRDELQQRLAGPRPPRLVQTLGATAFAAARIPGSERFGSVAEAVAALGDADEVVVYCSDVDCPSRRTPP